MAKQIFIGNLVKDAEAVTKEINGETRTFGAFTIAVDSGGDTPSYFNGYVNEKLTQYLKKGQQIIVAAAGVKIACNIYEKDGKQAAGYTATLVRPEVELGDVVYVTSRGRLAADVAPLEGKDFAAPRILSNPRAGGDKELPPVATSFVVGEKLLAAFGKGNVDVKAGREVTVQGKAVLNAYTTKEGEPRSELRMGNAEITLGRPRKDAAAAPAAAPAPAVAGDDFGDDDIPF